MEDASDPRVAPLSRTEKTVNWRVPLNHTLTQATGDFWQRLIGYRPFIPTP